MKTLRKMIVATLISIVLLAGVFNPVLASGGKVRGDEGAGNVSQHQVAECSWDNPCMP